MIRKLLETEHSKEIANTIVTLISEDQSLILDLLDIFQERDYRIIQRAAWPLTMLAENQPKLLKPYRGRMIDSVFNHADNDTIVRNILRAFQFLELPKDRWEEMIDFCFKQLEEPQTPVAIKVFSMQVLFQELKKFGDQDLLYGLAATIENYMPEGSAGFKSRGNKILKEIRSIDLNKSLWND